MNHKLAFIVVASVALVVGVATAILWYPREHPSNAAPDTTPRLAAASTGAANFVGEVPEFSLQNRDGQLQSLRSWPGKSLIVNFWATWCAPCRKEIPLLKEIAQSEAKNGFQVVGIAIDFREDVLKFAEEVNIDYPLLMGEEDGLKAADAFGINSAGLPFTVFSDNQHRIVATLMGELTQPKADIILAHVKRVNRGELTPDAARAAIQMQLAELPPTKH